MAMPKIPQDFVKVGMPTFEGAHGGDFVHTVSPQGVGRTYFVLDTAKLMTDASGNLVPSPDVRLVVKLLFSSDPKEKDAQEKALWSWPATDGTTASDQVYRAPNETRMREELTRWGGAVERSVFVPPQAFPWKPALIGLGVVGGIGAVIWLASRKSETSPGLGYVRERGRSGRRLKVTKAARKFIQEKIRKLVDEGFEQRQAVRVAYEMAHREGYKVPPPPAKKRR